MGVDPVGSMRGLTVWRPRPPSGYVPLGDVVVAGDDAPRWVGSLCSPGLNSCSSCWCVLGEEGRGWV